MNDAKQATPAAELERQICSATEPKNEREWWAHREIERLRDRLSVETLALVETLARAEKAEAEREELRADSELLRRIVEAQFIDGFGDVDFHEEAAIAAAENGREEPNTRDYIAAWRVAMEAER